MTDELFWKYMKCGGGESLGDPQTPERVEQDGQGQVVRYRDFQKGTIYWTSETGVSVVIEEKILQYWRAMGSAGRLLGFPTTDSKEGRGRVYNRFQHGTISCDPLSDVCEVYRDGRSSQDIRRWRSIFIVAVIWTIGTLLIVVLNNGGVEKGILSLITFLLGPLTALLFNLLWKQPNTYDGS